MFNGVSAPLTFRVGGTIIARKPTGYAGSSEWIVVDRGPGNIHQFVSATANELSLKNGEWFWGHYFTTREQALAHFNSRS